MRALAFALVAEALLLYAMRSKIKYQSFLQAMFVTSKTKAWNSSKFSADQSKGAHSHYCLGDN